MKATFFPDSAALRAWLRAHHASVPELWVGLYKKATGKPSITWPQLVDQLLCFGWIDGVRRSMDEESYAIRITPRRPASTWSTVNTKRAGELLAQGLMEPPGLAAFQVRPPERTSRYSFERERVAFPPAYLKQFRANPAAWTFFQAQPPSYRKTATWFVLSARREDTRLRRLQLLISDSAEGLRIGPMRR